MQESSAEKTKFVPAGQIQIIAKTLLIICGVYLSFMIVLKHCLGWQVYCRSGIISGIIFVITAMAVFCLLLYFLVLNNGWLVKRILPEEEPMQREKQKLWFIVSLRGGLVAIGLILLPSHIHILTDVVNLLIHLPAMCRAFITDAVQHNRPFQGFNIRTIQQLITIAIVIYLIAGAPGFVKWQVKKNFKGEIQ